MKVEEEISLLTRQVHLRVTNKADLKPRALPPACGESESSLDGLSVDN